MRALGRSLQLLGLIALPLGMYLQLTSAFQRDGVADLLLFAVFGFAVFYVGRFVEGYARS